MHVLLIGGTGLVGSNIRETAARRGHSVTSTFHTNSSAGGDVQLNKVNQQDVTDLVRNTRPDVVIDTAAFHDVDACETDRERAWQVNAQGTKHVAQAAKSVDAHVLYLSTDYVFAGVPDEAPFQESAPVNPVNYYAQTKYSGEQAAKIAADWTVLRTSVVFGLARPNFATWVLSELDNGDSVGIVDDQISTPTYAPALAEACVTLAEDELTGLYHAAGPEQLSRYEFTVRLAEAYGYDTSLVEPISTAELGQEAPRPANSSLDSSRLHSVLDSDLTRPVLAFDDMKTRSQG